jgi:hypothetical protein
MKDDIIRMAREAGIVVTGEAVWKLCELVRADEREACAAVARQWDADHPASNYGGCIANLIEARGQDAA